MVDTEELTARRDRLYDRLEKGYARIERGLAEKRHDEVHQWEDFWLQLLAEYEQVCREIQAAD